MNQKRRRFGSEERTEGRNLCSPCKSPVSVHKEGFVPRTGQQ